MYSREILNGLARSHPAARYLHCYRPHRLLRGLREARSPHSYARPLFESRQVWTADLFHGLNQRMPASRFRRAVCTFHDLFVLTGEYSTPEFRSRFAALAKEAAQRADLIVAVSCFTARQVETLLGVDARRIRVVPHGVRFLSLPATRPREKTILHVGALQVRKNIIRLIEAFEKAAPPDWRLVLAGSDGFGAEAVHARLAESPARDRISVEGWIGDRELQGWYSRAGVLAFPSLDEGFGIPALEAMAAGMPVLASKGTALEEVCGDAALLIDPFSTESIAAGLEQLTRDESLRALLTVKGANRAAQFPWERAVEETWKVYEELL